MSTGNFIEDLLAQVQAGGTKQASEEPKKGENPFAKNDDDGKDDEGKGKDDEGKGKDDEGKGKKEASLEDQLNALPDDLKKLASEQAFVMLQADMARRDFIFGQNTKAAAAEPAFDEKALFNMAFEERTTKLASQDPEYAAILQQERIKQAFNAGFADTVEQVKQAALAQHNQ